METLALQAVGRYVPAAHAEFITVDTLTATAVLVEYMFKNPIEQVIADPGTSEVALFALAHQWGRTQIQLDYINRYDKLVEHRHAEIQDRKRSLALASFFPALSSASHGMANGYNLTDAQRLSSEPGIQRNSETIQANNALAGALDGEGKSCEDIRLQISQTKQQLLPIPTYWKSVGTGSLGSVGNRPSNSRLMQ